MTGGELTSERVEEMREEFYNDPKNRHAIYQFINQSIMSILLKIPKVWIYKKNQKKKTKDKPNIFFFCRSSAYVSNNLH